MRMHLPISAVSAVAVLACPLGLIPLPAFALGKEKRWTRHATLHGSTTNARTGICTSLFRHRIGAASRDGDREASSASFYRNPLPVPFGNTLTAFDSNRYCNGWACGTVGKSLLGAPSSPMSGYAVIYHHELCPFVHNDYRSPRHAHPHCVHSPDLKFSTIHHPRV